MKNIVFIYCGFDLTHAFDKIFSGICAFERVLLWTKNIPNLESIKILVNPELSANVKECLKNQKNQNISSAKIIEKSSWNTQLLLETMAIECQNSLADFAIFTSADKPFLDIELTSEILSEHQKYLAEYTFADGFPEGFAPQVISSGTLNLLSELVKTKTQIAQSKVNDSSIFNVLKTDINSFEIESYIAPKDFRMLRLDFSCSSKLLTLSCKNLYDEALNSKVPFKALELSELAQKSAKCQQTVPAFYNIQISAKSSSKATYNPEFPFSKDENPFMNLEHFKALLSQISLLSEEAVISLSAFGEPFTNPQILLYISEVLKNPHFNLILETEGIELNQEIILKIKNILDSSPKLKKSSPNISQLENRINFIVYLDAFSKEKYFELHKNCPEDSFEKAKASLELLEESFPNCVYPLFTRTQENENELEKFYRFYHDEKSVSKGHLIIQKYDDYCKLLSQKKVADLTPYERNVCWHLKRDVTILKDGSVPLCKEFFNETKLGNVFEEGLENLWAKTNQIVQNQIEKKYLKKCEDCDEYYTFNF